MAGEQENRVVLVIGSACGERAAGRSTAHGVSKAVHYHFARYVAARHGAASIRRNAISIGVGITTTAAARLVEPVRSIRLDNHLTAEPGKPKVIADLVGYLAPDRSCLIVGSVTSVGGGFVSHVGMPARWGRSRNRRWMVVVCAGITR
jgi:NAD(P)-dependent dehydrogenase (short-subunit alcohol dehydrogenase family)